MQGLSAQQAGDLVAGDILGGYRVGAKMAVGGMGEIYRAEHVVLGRLCAIKVLRPMFSCNEVMVQRFFNEAKAATAIAHPGIIDVYDFGYHCDGRAYLIMELLQGQDLGDRLRGQGQLSERATVAIARGIASALAAAHAAGIVHRDLKPDNIFLVADADVASGERAKVLDFGVAKLNDQLAGDQRKTQTGALMGTPLYMAPEQARAASAIDHRADLYSLGCIMYQMLTGSPPFVGEGAGEIIALQMFTEPEPLSARLAQISPALETLVLRLLQKEPADRFSDAKTLGIALDQLGDSAAHIAAIKTPRSARRGSMMLAQQPVKAVEAQRPADPHAETVLTVPHKASKSRPAVLLLIVAGVGVAVVLALAFTRKSEPAKAPLTLSVTTGAQPLALGTASAIPSREPTPTPVSAEQGALIWRGSPAAVTIIMDNQSLDADTTGRFRIVLDGKRRVASISAAGYQTKTAEITCERSQELNLQLARLTARPIPATRPEKIIVKPASTGLTTANGSPVETGI